MRQPQRPIIRLLRLAFSLKWWIALAVLFGVLTVGSGVGLMATSAYLLSEAALHPSIAALDVAIVGVRFFGISRGVYRYLERYVSHTVTFRLLARLRTWFYSALEPLAPARLAQFGHEHPGAFSSGDLLARVVSDIETLQNFYVRVIAPPVVAAIIGLAMWFFLGAFAPMLALLFMLFFVLTGVGVPFLTYLLSHRLGRQIVSARAALNMQLVDGVQGMADLVAFNRERDQLARIESLNTTLTRLQARMAAITGLQNALGALFLNLSIWAMFLVAIPMVSQGHLNGVYLAALALASLASFEAVLPLSSAAQFLGSSREAARRLFEIVDAEGVGEPARGQPSPEPLNYDISAQRVRFRYAPGEPLALDNISFSLPQGKCVAIVGPSGAGKSSIVNLLLRFWDYQEGHIFLGGHELREYLPQDVQTLMSVVTQHTHLFNTSIRENLLIARSGASQQELLEASKQAHIHDFIQSLPQGYDTQVGELGLNLSGGERQRIAIARALLKDAPILILDEPTANLDSLTEQAVLQSLRTLMQGRTTLLITHRLVGLDMADEILVLQNGHIRERGTHHDLLQLEGLYWKMWQLSRQVLSAS